MAAVGIALLVIGALIVYEVVKGGGITAASATTPSGTGSTGVSAISPSPSGLIPTSWLTALAAHESPSALQGDFTYGAFGLSAGSTPGIGVPGTTSYGSQDPRGGSFTPQLYSGWNEAVAGLENWINQYAPEAYGAGSCSQFVAILQQHGYGPLAGTC